MTSNLTPEHLDRAVARAVITGDQRAALVALARETADPATADPAAAVRREEEPFRFVTSFNDIFLAIGVILFTIAAGSLTDSAPNAPVGAAAAALALWLVSEIIAARMRRAIPSVLAAAAFVAFATRATYEAFLAGAPLERWHVYLMLLARPLRPGLYFLRFRLPFALLMIAAAVILFSFAVFLDVMGADPANVDLDEIPRSIAFFTLVAGSIVFTIAMTFDRADPDRVTIKADYAFWLHLLAAPLIVHALMYFLTGSDEGFFPDIDSRGGAVAVLAVFLVLAAIALIIDRRAVLVASLTYLGAAVYNLVSRSDYVADDAAMVSTLLVALLVIGLGVAWRPVRGVLMRAPPLRELERLALARRA